VLIVGDIRIRDRF